MEIAAFYAFATVAVASALFILFSRSLMHAAFALFFTLVAVSALYILSGSDFLGIAQIMIYVGGILILIIFGIMLTRPARAGNSVSSNRIEVGASNRFLGGLAAAGLLALLLLVVLSTRFVLSGEVREMHSTLRSLGMELMTRHLLPFEMAAVLLLVVLIGASYLALNRKSST